MFVFAIICQLLQLTLLNAFPGKEPENTTDLYDVLVHNCPNLNLNDESFRNQDIFKRCKNWQQISETNNLSRDTEGNLLCLLYHDSFMSFCTELKAAKKNITMDELIPNLKGNSIENICKDFPIVKKFEHKVLEQIKAPACYKLCANFDASLVPECALAHYYVAYNNTKPVVNEVSHINQTKPNVSTPAALPGNVNLDPSVPLKSKLLNAQGSPENKNENTNMKTVQEPAIEVVGKNVQASKNIEKQVASDQGVESPLPTELVAASVGSEKNSKTDNDAAKLSTNKDNDTSKSAIKEVDSKPVVIKNEPSQGSSSVATPAKTVSDPVTQPKYVEEQIKVENALAETEAAGEQDSLVPPDTMMGENEEEEDGSDTNYKDEDQAPAVGNVAAGEKKEKPSTLTLSEDVPANYNTAEDLDGESYFFSYFMVICVLFVLGYVGYHNRQKVMALMLEGKRGKRQGRSRRPNSANYHKLDSNLEEAMSSSCTKNSSHVIY